jgi:hypothetical protein
MPDDTYHRVWSVPVERTAIPEDRPGASQAP